MPYSLTYASWAVEPPSTTALVELLKVCRRNNEKNAVTGMLLYREGTFMQVLEGEEETLRWLYEKIGHDRTHRDLSVLTEGKIEQRVFPDWSMGFYHLTDRVAALSGYSEFLNRPLTDQWYAEHPSRSARLLAMFKELKSG